MKKNLYQIKTVFLINLYLIVTVCSADAQKQYTGKSLLPNFNENAVVKIFSYKGMNLSYSGSLITYNYYFDPVITHGSGVMIDPNGIILTAKHVIDSARFIAVKIPGNNVTFPAEVVQSTDNSDYAFLVIKVQNQEYIKLPAKAPQLLRGQQIWTYGYPIIPGEPEPNITKGIITRFSQYFRMWQLDAAVHGGSSGGPLVDDKGNIVGVIVAKLKDAEGMNFALPMDTILMTYKNLKDSDMFSLDKQTLGNMKPEKYKSRTALAKFLANTAINYIVYSDSEDFGTLKKEIEAIDDTNAIISEWALYKELSSGLHFNQASQMLDNGKKSFYSAKDLAPEDAAVYSQLINKAENDANVAKAISKNADESLNDLIYYIGQAQSNIVSGDYSDTNFPDNIDESDNTGFTYWNEDEILKLISYFDSTEAGFKGYWGNGPVTSNENGMKLLTYSNLVVKLKDDKVKELSFYYNTLPNKPIEAFKGLNVYLLKSTIISTLGDDFKTEKLNKDTFNHEALTWNFKNNIKMTLVFSEGGYCYYVILKTE